VQPSDGWLLDAGAPGNRLYVNRGIGLSHLPLRIGCPPELTFFSLHAV
jgi:predicted MPP superfamily phosphohydrolase